MSRFIVEGGKKLRGSITVAGNKNEALALIAASMLCPGTVVFSNVPDIGDVKKMATIAEILGSRTKWQGANRLVVDASDLSSVALPSEQSGAIRASILFASSLLVRKKEAIIIQPGGDNIGRRRLDTHFHAFKALGASLRIERRGTSEIIYHLEAPDGLKGTELYLDETSVTATENAIIAAAGAIGTTTIYNAASEPHVQGVCGFLEKAGVKFSGIGSNVLTIYGRESFNTSFEWEVGADYIEAGSFIGLAAATKSALTIRGIDPRQMRMILLQFERIGVHVETDVVASTLYVPENQPMMIKRDLGDSIPRIEDGPWPGFPTDLMSILLVTATQSSGTCLIHEKMFESRLFFVDKLISMGAQIVLCDPHRAVIIGPSHLYGAKISSPDIRAGMALLIAALAAEGQSVIDNIAQIDRGYERIDERLRLLGAEIVRIDESRRGAV